MPLKNQILQDRNDRVTNIISMCPDQTTTNLTQQFLLLLDQKFGILFLLILSSQKHLKCLKNSSKHEMEKCVSAVCAHAIRIIK